MRKVKSAIYHWIFPLRRPAGHLLLVGMPLRDLGFGFGPLTETSISSLADTHGLLNGGGIENQVKRPTAPLPASHWSDWRADAGNSDWAKSAGSVL
jgi:hypothetical protein